MSDWFRPAGSSGDADFDVRITPGDPGWAHTGLYAATLQPGESRTIDTGDCEWIVLPLSGGGAVVEVGSARSPSKGARTFSRGRPTSFTFRGTPASPSLARAVGGSPSRSRKRGVSSPFAVYLPPQSPLSCGAPATAHDKCRTSGLPVSWKRIRSLPAR